MIRVLFLILIVMSAAAFAQTGERSKAVLIDEFETATNGSVKMKMDYFYTELSNNPSSQGVIINYGTAREIAIRERQIRVSIQWRKYDAARITLVNGGFNGDVKSEFWLVPAGAENPKPDERAVLFDEFSPLSHERASAGIGTFFAKLKENPNSRGIIVNYGSPRMIAISERNLKTVISNLKIDSGKITFKVGGVEKTYKTELWIVPAEEKSLPKTKIYIVPPGAKPPTP